MILHFDKFQIAYQIAIVFFIVWFITKKQSILFFNYNNDIYLKSWSKLGVFKKKSKTLKTDQLKQISKYKHPYQYYFPILFTYYQLHNFPFIPKLNFNYHFLQINKPQISISPNIWPFTHWQPFTFQNSSKDISVFSCKPLPP